MIHQDEEEYEGDGRTQFRSTTSANCGGTTNKETLTLIRI